MKFQAKSRRVTLLDVAREAGYSVTAVSRALKDMPDIGQQAKEKIRESAARLGYVANHTAVALRSGHTHMITVILANLVNPFFNQVTDFIQIAAQQQGYSLIIVCSRDSAQLEMQLVEQAIANRSDGVMIFPTKTSGPAIERLQKAGVPFVLLCCPLPPYVTDTVVIDDYNGVHQAVRHLVEAGCDKLAYLSSTNASPSYEPRLHGFLTACEHYGIGPENRRVHLQSFLFINAKKDEKERHATVDMLRELKREGFRGLFIFCDVEAMRVMSVIEQTPDLSQEDFSIVGFDNIEEALISPLPLCSVDCGLEEMANRSIALLLSRIEGDERPPQVIACPTRIVCRGSCYPRQ